MDLHSRQQLHHLNDLNTEVAQETIRRNQTDRTISKIEQIATSTDTNTKILVKQLFKMNRKLEDMEETQKEIINEIKGKLLGLELKT